VLLHLVKEGPGIRFSNLFYYTKRQPGIIQNLSLQGKLTATKPTSRVLAPAQNLKLTHKSRSFINLFISQMNPIHILVLHFFRLMSTYLHVRLLNCLFPSSHSVFGINLWVHHSHACYTSGLSNPPWFYCRNSIWQCVEVLALPVQFSPFFYYFISNTYRYPSQNTVLSNS
jgi:hypothetical protein